jgi:hypothetical protein
VPKPTEPLAIEDIPLPPEDPDFEAPETDQGSRKPEPEETEPPQPSAKALPIAELEFLDDDGVVVPLKHPFKLAGRIVNDITCRPLTLGVAQDLTRRSVREDGIELVEIYAVIAGLDVAVLRGMKEDDGRAIVEAARDFLPRAFRGDQESA